MMQEKEDATEVDLKEEVKRESKQPPQSLRSNGRIVEFVSARRRLTRGLAKQQTQTWLIETYESTRETLRRVREGEAGLGPATLARVRKTYAITRGELLRRGVPKDDLDYEPESEEVQEAAA